MGKRFILTIICPECENIDDDVYFAPTCGFTSWTCNDCKHKLDLIEYTGITYEDADTIGLQSKGGG